MIAIRDGEAQAEAIKGEIIAMLPCSVSELSETIACDNKPPSRSYKNTCTQGYAEGAMYSVASSRGLNKEL